jgi:hypothetical protein
MGGSREGRGRGVGEGGGGGGRSECIELVDGVGVERVSRKLGKA